MTTISRQIEVPAKSEISERIEPGPLQGVRILDMATVLAAPFAATLCGDMGADVVKLELPEGGDTLRALAPVMADGTPLYWKVVNRGKRGITLDVRKAEGHALFLRMLPNFDVLVENFRTGTLDRWGLDLATLHAHNPSLIVLRLTGFGQTGPYARRPGFARVFEAMSGFANLTGEPGRSPQHMNYPLGDVVSGLFGAFAISTALAGRKRDAQGVLRGCEIDLSATEAMFRLLDALPAEYHHMGQIRARTGARASYTAPSGIYMTADGRYLTLVGSGNAVFVRLSAAMGRPELATDPRFSHTGARIANLEAVDKLVSDWCASMSLEQVSALLEEHQVTYCKVYNIEDAMTDPHFLARRAVIDLPDPDLGTVPAPCAVPRFNGASAPIPRTGPATGEHNANFYSELGLSADDIGALRLQKVI